MDATVRIQEPEHGMGGKCADFDSILPDCCQFRDHCGSKIQVRGSNDADILRDPQSESCRRFIEAPCIIVVVAVAGTGERLCFQPLPESFRHSAVIFTPAGKDRILP